jgi:hypothetical protein
MSLADKLSTLAPSAPGLQCGIDKILRKSEEKDREALISVMSTPAIKGSISNVQIHKLLISEGYDIAFASIRLHRGQRCRCYIGQEARQSAEAKVKK